MKKKYSYLIAPLIFILFSAILALLLLWQKGPVNKEIEVVISEDEPHERTGVILTPKNDPWLQMNLELMEEPVQNDRNISLMIESPFKQGVSQYILNDNYDIYVDGSLFTVDSIQTIENEFSYRLILMVDRSYSANNRIESVGQSKHGLFNKTLRYFWDNLKYRDIEIEVYFFQSRQFMFIEYGPVLYGPYKIKTIDDLRKAVAENDKSLGGTPLSWAIGRVFDNLMENKDDTLQTHIVVLTDGIDSHGGTFPMLNNQEENIFVHSFAGISERDRNTGRFDDFEDFIINSGGFISTEWDSLFKFVDHMSGRAFADYILFARPQMKVTIEPLTFEYKSLSMTLEERPFVDRIYFPEDFDTKLPENQYEKRFRPFISKIASRMDHNPDNLLMLTGYISFAEFNSGKYMHIARERENFVKNLLIDAGIDEYRIMRNSDFDSSISLTDFRRINKPPKFKPNKAKSWYREMPCPHGLTSNTTKSDDQMIAEHSRSVLISAIPYSGNEELIWKSSMASSPDMDELIGNFQNRFKNLDEYIHSKEFKPLFNQSSQMKLIQLSEHLRKNPDSYLVYYSDCENPFVAEDKMHTVLERGLEILRDEQAKEIVDRAYLIPEDFCYQMPGLYNKEPGDKVCRKKWQIENSMTFRPLDTAQTELQLPERPGSFRIRTYDTSASVSVICSLAIADDKGNVISPIISGGSLRGHFDPGLLPIGRRMDYMKSRYKAACFYHWESEDYNISCNGVSYSNEFSIVSENIKIDNSKLIEQYNFDTYRPKSSYFTIRIPEIVKSIEAQDSLPEIHIFGNTCPIGSDIRNRELSSERTWFLANKIKSYSPKDLRIIAYPCYAQPPIFQSYGSEIADTLDFDLPENRSIARSAFIRYHLE